MLTAEPAVSSASSSSSLSSVSAPATEPLAADGFRSPAARSDMLDESQPFVYELERVSNVTSTRDKVELGRQSAHEDEMLVADDIMVEEPVGDDDAGPGELDPNGQLDDVDAPDGADATEHELAEGDHGDEVDDEDAEELAEGLDDQDDGLFHKRRAEAMDALTKLEIDFARLRDRMYLERMAEIEKERIGIQLGSHPELMHLSHLIETRRTRKLELAKRWLDGYEHVLERKRHADEHTAWLAWANERSDLRTTYVHEANSKRRRLEREKRFFRDRPREGGLSPLLAARPPRGVPLEHRRRVGFDGDGVQEPDIAWATRHQDVQVDSTVVPLATKDILMDLERMGQAPPSHFSELPGYDPALYGAYELSHQAYPGQRAPLVPTPSALSLPPTLSMAAAQSQQAGSPAPFSPIQHVARDHTRQASSPRPLFTSVATGPLAGIQSRVGAFHPSSFYPGPPPLFPGERDGDAQAWAASSTQPPPGQLGDAADIYAARRNRETTPSTPASRSANDTKGGSRFTLDDHMAIARSPRTGREVSSHGRRSPPFLSMPALGQHNPAHQAPVLPSAYQ